MKGEKSDCIIKYNHFIHCFILENMYINLSSMSNKVESPITTLHQYILWNISNKHIFLLTTHFVVIQIHQTSSLFNTNLQQFPHHHLRSEQDCPLESNWTLDTAVYIEQDMGAQYSLPHVPKNT